MKEGSITTAAFMARCGRCDELCQLPEDALIDNARAVLPAVFSLIDPPAVAKPRLLLLCKACAEKTYGVEGYREAVAEIQKRSPN